MVEVEGVDGGLTTTRAGAGDRQRLRSDLSRKCTREWVTQKPEDSRAIPREECRTEAVEISEHAFP